MLIAGPIETCDVAAQRSGASGGLRRQHNWTIRLKTGFGIRQSRFCLEFSTASARIAARDLATGAKCFTRAGQRQKAGPRRLLISSLRRNSDCPSKSKPRRLRSAAAEWNSANFRRSDRASDTQVPPAPGKEFRTPATEQCQKSPRRAEWLFCIRELAGTRPIRPRPEQPASPWPRFRPGRRRAIAALSRAGLRTNA